MLGAFRGQMRASNALELSYIPLLVAVWVLGIEPGSSGKAATVLPQNHLSGPSDLILHYFFLLHKTSAFLVFIYFLCVGVVCICVFICMCGCIHACVYIHVGAVI